MEFLECPCCRKLLVKEKKLNVLKLLDSMTVQEISEKHKLSYEDLAAEIMKEYIGRSRDKIRAYFMVLGAKKKELKVKDVNPPDLTRDLNRLSRNMGSIIAPSALIKKVAESLNKILYQNYLENMERIENELDMTFKPNMEAVKRIQKYNFNLIKTLNSEQIDKLRGVITRGLISGSNLRAMQQELMKQVDISEYNAERIVRTENLRVANVGYYDGAMRSKLPGWFEWVATEDNRTSDICRKLDGQRIDKDDPKSVFHAKVGKQEFTGRFPPAHPNCRSGLKFIPKLE